MKPETAMTSWQQWQARLSDKPSIISKLEGGLSNRNYLLESSGIRMVLRLHDNDGLLPWANRLNEITCWQAASAKGIAPPLLFIDKKNRFLVSQFIKQDLPPQSEMNATSLKRVFSLVEQCHRLEVDVPTLDYQQHIDHYWALISKHKSAITASLLCQREPMQRLLAALIRMNPKKGLCHHDLVKANFVGGPDRYYLIDWEYAANGLTIMDHAALAIEWKIDDTKVLQNSGHDPEQLDMAKLLYRYICTLWEQARR